jgi:hypothetical protein
MQRKHAVIPLFQGRKRRLCSTVDMQSSWHGFSCACASPRLGRGRIFDGSSTPSIFFYMYYCMCCMCMCATPSQVGILSMCAECVCICNIINHARACIVVHVHTTVHKYVHTGVKAHTYTYIHTGLNDYMQTILYINIHTYIHTYNHTYIHTHIPRRSTNVPAAGSAFKLASAPPAPEKCDTQSNCKRDRRIAHVTPGRTVNAHACHSQVHHCLLFVCTRHIPVRMPI